MYRYIEQSKKPTLPHYIVSNIKERLAMCVRRGLHVVHEVYMFVVYTICIDGVHVVYMMCSGTS